MLSPLYLSNATNHVLHPSPVLVAAWMVGIGALMISRVRTPSLKRITIATDLVRYALVGAVNIPIINRSVVWWNSLHQGQSLQLIGKSAIDPSMLHPLQLMIVAFASLFVALLLVRADTALKAVKLRRLQIQRIARKNAAIEG